MASSYSDPHMQSVLDTLRRYSQTSQNSNSENNNITNISNNSYQQQQQESSYSSSVVGKCIDIVASTICSSLGELMVTPCDSDVTWRSDVHF